MAQDLTKIDELARQLAGLGITKEELAINDEAAEGISESFPILSIKGKEWTLKFQGLPKTHTIRDEEGNEEPARSINVIIVRPSKQVQKTFWKGGFDEKNPRQPDCKATNGKVPDAGVPERQSALCENCRWNQWNTGPVSGKGAKAKACSDSKALAVFVPKTLLPSPPYRAALVRLPPTSLQNFKKYSDALKAKGIPLNRMITKMTFQAGITQTMIEFEPLKLLDIDTYNSVVNPIFEDPTTERMLYSEIRHDDVQDIAEQQRIMGVEQPDVTGFEDIISRPEPGPTRAAPEPVQAKAEPAPAPKLVKTKDGRWFDPVSKKFVEPEKPKAKRPENLIEAEDGSFIDTDTGEVYPAEALPWEDEKPAAKPAAKPAPESATDELGLGGAATPAPKAETPPTDLAEAKARRSRKGPSKEAAPAAKEVPVQNGNAVPNGAGVVVTDTTQEVADALSELFPGGVPGE